MVIMMIMEKISAITKNLPARLTATTAHSEGDEVESGEAFAELLPGGAIRRPPVEVKVFQVVVAATAAAPIDAADAVNATVAVTPVFLRDRFCPKKSVTES